MGPESEKAKDAALEDPGKLYKTPEAILSDAHLTQEQKDRILHNWEEDLLALMRAEEENMASKGSTFQPIEVLEKVKEAEKVLGIKIEGEEKT